MGTLDDNITRCPRCKTESEITDRRQTLVTCPKCGLTSMLQRKTVASDRATTARSPMLDAASTKTVLWIILGSVGAVAFALIVVVVVIATRGSSRTVAQDTRDTDPSANPPAQVVPPTKVQPATSAPQRAVPAIEPPPDRASPSQIAPKPAQPAQPQTAEPPVIVIPTTPSRPAAPTEPVVITLGGARNITIPDPSFEAQKDGYFPTFAGWTDVYPSSINIMHEVVSASHPNIDGRKFMRLYMDCGGTLQSANWDFRSPKLGRYEAGRHYRFTISLSRSGDDDNRKVTIALATPDTLAASKAVPFPAMSEEIFKDFSVDLDVPSDSPYLGKDIHVVIRCEAQNTRHGRNVNIDNLRLTAQQQ